MSSIIVVFPKKEIATNIRNILVRNGFDVIGVGVTGAQAVQLADNLDDGIVVCGYKMTDMLYNELMNTIEMMAQSIGRRRKKRRAELKNRNPEQQALVKEAKSLLMERNNMTEEEAHRYLQKCSMESGVNMVETAQMVLSIMAE